MPERLDLSTFRSYINDFGGPAQACRFGVRILPQGDTLLSIIQSEDDSAVINDLFYLCESAEYPGRGFMNIDNRHYGPNFKLPYQSVYEDITLTFLCRGDSRERQFFDNWQYLINPTQSFNFSYRTEYRSQIEVYQIDEHNVSTYQYKLHEAYPVLVNSQQLTWADDQFLRLSVTFTYTWWTRPDMDISPRPITNAPSAHFTRLGQ